ARDYGKTYDGLAYSGGNDVDYSGFVGGEDKTVLGGTLGYSGTSQGAKYAGSYIITPKGYTATNYILTYVDGQLVIQGGPGTQQASPASGSLLPATNPQSEVQNTVPQGIQLIGNSNMAQDATLLLSVASDSVSSVAPDSVSNDAPDSVSSDAPDSDSLEGEEKDEE
ncbi:MAG: hypothetical protein GX043_07105, partial [Desulfovibrionales bacterium]|nr:hypothetical protein [Desulfovibrionales bacterium]